MNGIIVYDSYAKITGNKKIVDYFENQKIKKVNPFVLFDENEVKEVHKNLFSEKAWERDFKDEYDKTIFRNLPASFGI